MSILMPVPHWPDYCGFILSFEIRIQFFLEEFQFFLEEIQFFLENFNSSKIFWLFQIP